MAGESIPDSRYSPHEIDHISDFASAAGKTGGETFLKVTALLTWEWGGEEISNWG